MTKNAVEYALSKAREAVAGHRNALTKELDAIREKVRLKYEHQIGADKVLAKQNKLRAKANLIEVEMAALDKHFHALTGYHPRDSHNPFSYNPVLKSKQQEAVDKSAAFRKIASANEMYAKFERDIVFSEQTDMAALLERFEKAVKAL